MLARAFIDGLTSEKTQSLFKERGFARFIGTRSSPGGRVYVLSGMVTSEATYLVKLERDRILIVETKAPGFDGSTPTLAQTKDALILALA